MTRELQRRSDIEKMVATGEAIKEPPRQPIRETSTGRLISNQRVPDMLPTYLIAVQSNTLIYNDIDVADFQREVSRQTSKILAAIGDAQFENAGTMYQQFIDQYDACFETPSVTGLEEVKRRGIDLYAVLERQGTRLAAELGVENEPNRETVHRFNAVTESHIRLFFYMLTLNLALHNKIDIAQKQLRQKLGLLDKRLKDMLHQYIYADCRGVVRLGEIDGSETLYGWILLERNSLDEARAIYKRDLGLKETMSFAALHHEVMSIYHKPSYSSQTPGNLREAAFRGRKLSNGRADIALQLCLYLSQTEQIRFYLDELTQGSENPEPDDATVDVRSLLVPSSRQIVAP